MDNLQRLKILQAIKDRHSVRKYKTVSLNSDLIGLLNTKIEELNRLGNLNMQLITDEPKGFSGLFAYGKFSGVLNYVVVAGHKDDTFDERVGYYGEQLVLFAQMLGLNTCWAGLSYKKVPNTYVLEKGQKISCYIALGYGETQGKTHKIKKPEDVSNITESSPEWFKDGVISALLAPTAINQQKFRFELLEPQIKGEKAKVSAKGGFSIVGYTKIDLGIAKYHFEIGADPQNFEWV